MQKENCTQEFELRRDLNFDHTVPGNLYNLVAPGLLVDGATGAMFTIRPANVTFIDSPATCLSGTEPVNLFDEHPHARHTRRFIWAANQFS